MGFAFTCPFSNSALLALRLAYSAVLPGNECMDNVARNLPVLDFKQVNTYTFTGDGVRRNCPQEANDRERSASPALWAGSRSAMNCGLFLSGKPRPVGGELHSYQDSTSFGGGDNARLTLLERFSGGASWKKRRPCPARPNQLPGQLSAGSTRQQIFSI